MKIHFIKFKHEMNCPKHKNDKQSGFVFGNMLFVKNSDLKVDNWKKFVLQHYPNYKSITSESKAVIFSSGAVWQIEQKYSIFCLYPHIPKNFEDELQEITEYIISSLKKAGTIKLINTIGFKIYLYTPDNVKNKYYAESFKTTISITDQKMNETKEYVLKAEFDHDGYLKFPDTLAFGAPKPLYFNVPETPVTSSWNWS